MREIVPPDPNMCCSSVFTARIHPQMLKEHKALVIQKYARAWMARRRFQTMRRLVLNVQLSFRVQQLRKKIEDQVRDTSRVSKSAVACFVEERVFMCHFCFYRIKRTEAWWRD